MNFFLTIFAAAVMGLSSAAGQTEITFDGQETDVFAGVPARYVTYPSNTGEYCCAGYVMRFYGELFGVTITNINTCDAPPEVSCPGHEVQLVLTNDPQPFDLAQTKSRTHVAVVKRPTAAGAAVIEQNYKYWSEGCLVTEPGREVTSEEYCFYRLLIDGVSARIIYLRERLLEIVLSLMRTAVLS